MVHDGEKMEMAEVELELSEDEQLERYLSSWGERTSEWCSSYVAYHARPFHITDTEDFHKRVMKLETCSYCAKCNFWTYSL